MDRNLFAAALGLLLSLSSCTPLSPLRPNTEANRTASVLPADGYKIAFVEFGEQGSYQDPQQLTNALQLIRTTEKPLVITYVHGWQNNARSGDVAAFGSLLARLQHAPTIQQAGFHILGMYLSWRGRITDVPLVKELSFWNRKATAEKLASNYDCYDAIASISEEARKTHGRGEQYTVLLGHSFGGLIVERAVAHAINAEIHGHASEEQSMPADLMIAVNPASDSVLARQMINALYVRKTEGSRPLFVSVTSTADWATGKFFPLGTGSGSLTKGFNQVPVPGPAKLTQSERKYYTSTPGHNQSLINHYTRDLHQTITRPNDRSAFDLNLEHNLTGDVFALDNKAGQLELWQFQHIGDVDVPYWDISVDPSIIKDHGDLWNERAEAMMAAIFRIANPLINRSVRPRATLHRAPEPARVPATPQASPPTATTR